MSFTPGDKVTVVMNPQCHGTVLENNDGDINVKLDNHTVSQQFKTSDLKPRKYEQQPQS